jgi:hypothetical protein
MTIFGGGADFEALPATPRAGPVETPRRATRCTCPQVAAVEDRQRAISDLDRKRGPSAPRRSGHVGERVHAAGRRRQRDMADPPRPPARRCMVPGRRCRRRAEVAHGGLLRVQQLRQAESMVIRWATVSRRSPASSPLPVGVVTAAASRVCFADLLARRPPAAEIVRNVVACRAVIPGEGRVEVV